MLQTYIQFKKAGFFKEQGKGEGGIWWERREGGCKRKKGASGVGRCVIFFRPWPIQSLILVYGDIDDALWGVLDVCVLL